MSYFYLNFCLPTLHLKGKMSQEDLVIKINLIMQFI